VKNGSCAVAAAQRSHLALVQEVLLAHKFRIGDNVHIIAGLLGRGDSTGVYKVVRVLPTEGDEQQYRIKSANEPHERVAKQSQLERAA